MEKDFDIDFTCEVNEVERDVRCVGKFTPGSPDVLYMRNGDPGYQGDSPEAEVSAMWMDGKAVTSEEIDSIVQSDMFYDILLNEIEKSQRECCEADFCDCRGEGGER